MELQNKRILISGGTSGLGFELAGALLKKGAHIFICSRNQESVDKAKIRLNSDNVRALKCDITDPEDLKNLIQEVPNLDGLINNAGVWLEGSVESNSLQEISKTIDINLKGLIYCTNIFLPTLKKKESFIVNISSTSGIDIKANQPVYTASKWGVRGFTESIKEDLKDTKVKVIGVYPGGMKTNLFAASGVNKDVSDFIEPRLIATEIVHILEQDESFVTDSVIFRRTTD